MENLAKFGFNDWFKERIDDSKKGFEIARILSVNKNSYVVSRGVSEIYAELTGKFLFNSDSPLDLPTVGDWVYVQIFDDDTLAIIHDVMPRRTLLKRKAAGKKVDFQLIAANIDTAVIMQSLDENFNLRRLERYLTIIYESGITPVILLSKSDLMDEEEIAKKKDEIKQIAQGVELVSFSNNSKDDIIDVKSLFAAGKTYCLLGSSGVGKTTLLNNLLDHEVYKTQAVREKDSRGKHTTTRRELTLLDNGAIIIDSPGMRELGVISVEAGLSETFDEISEYAGGCKYEDCTHTVEKGCAITAAVEEGKISRERYENYIKMLKESKYLEMSYIEKRQKDKKFGKMMSDYAKHKDAY